MAAAQVDLEIEQGATFQYITRWYEQKQLRPITAITSAAPAVVTATAHGLPTDATPVWIDNVRGMKVPKTLLRAQRLTADTFSLLDFDSTASGAYVGGGTLTYYAPVDLTGYTARMHIRKSVSSAEILHLLTTENGKIQLTPAEGRIVLSVTATDTAALTFTSAVYDLELVSPSGYVTRLLQGNVSLIKEVTR